MKKVESIPHLLVFGSTIFQTKIKNNFSIFFEAERKKMIFVIGSFFHFHINSEV